MFRYLFAYTRIRVQSPTIPDARLLCFLQRMWGIDPGTPSNDAFFVGHRGIFVVPRKAPVFAYRHLSRQALDPTPS
jgi:hypothetical protein